MKKFVVAAVVIATIVVAATAGAFAQSLWAQNSFARPVFAPADVICYSVEPWFELASTTSRPDVLATFVKRDSGGFLTQVCFLRTPAGTPLPTGWIEITR